MTAPTSISVPLIKKIDGIFHPSEELFQTLTGAVWLQEMHIPDPLASNSIAPTSHERDMLKFLKPLYQVYLKRPPHLYVKEGKAHGCHSLHANEKIIKGTIITEYLGAWDPERKHSSSYRWGPIDGHHHRNYGPMIEDGFPNIGAFHLYGINQLPMRIIFITLEDIIAGDIITVNYGLCHSVKLLENRVEYRLEQMIEFFKRYPLSKILIRINELRKKPSTNLGWTKTLELENLGAKLQYLFQTPSAINAIIERRIFTKQEILGFFENSDVRYNILGFPFKLNPREQEIVNFFNTLKTAASL